MSIHKHCYALLKLPSRECHSLYRWEWKVPEAKRLGSGHECLGQVGSVASGLATSYIEGASGPQQNFLGVQGPAGGPDTPALRESLSPLTVPITLSMCFLTEGHGESLAEAIIKVNLDILYVRIAFYWHSLSVGLDTRLAAWIIPASGPHITECEKETPEAAFEQAATSGIRPWKLSANENAFPGVSLRDPAIASPDDGRTHGTGAFDSTDLKAVSALALILVCQHWTSRTLSPWLGLRLQGFKEPRSEQKPLP